MVKALLALPLLIVLGASAQAADDVKTGRSVAVTQPAPTSQPAQKKYWLSDSLNRLFLVQPDTPARSEETSK